MTDKQKKLIKDAMEHLRQIPAEYPIISLAGDSWTWTGHVDDLKENGFIVVEEKEENKKLKPCPFCGSDGFIEDESDHHGRYINLGCSNKKCPCNWFIVSEGIENDEDLKEAIEKWNRRAEK